MPVYDYTYQTWEGERRGAFLRWLAMPRFTYMDLFKKRQVIVLFMLCCLQFLLRLAYQYLRVNEELLALLKIGANLPDVDAKYFRWFLDGQLFASLVFSFTLTAVITDDLIHHAIVLYMSKPISRWEYFAGKFLTVFLPLSFLTIIQAVVLYAVQVAIAPEQDNWHLYFWRDYAWMLKSLILYGGVISGTLSLLILTASCLTKNRRYAGVIFLVSVIGLDLIANTTTEILSRKEYLAISPLRSVQEIGRYCFQTPVSECNFSLAVAWTGVLACWGLCALLLHWRISHAARYEH
jgi:ABC-type transport system involved in multi-copper enzyme maturation permease subunit